MSIAPWCMNHGYQPCECPGRGQNIAWQWPVPPPDMPIIKLPPVRTAWVCPVCKSGVAPHVERCPCVDTAAKGADHG
jgi:hypothetical protein